METTTRNQRRIEINSAMLTGLEFAKVQKLSKPLDKIIAIRQHLREAGYHIVKMPKS